MENTMVLNETMNEPEFGTVNLSLTDCDPQAAMFPQLALMPIGSDYSGGQNEGLPADFLPALLFDDDDTEEEDMDEDENFDDMDDDFDDDFDEEDDFDDEDDDYEDEDEDYDYEEDVDYDDFDE